MRSEETAEHLVKEVMVLSEDCSTRVRADGEESEGFPMNVGVNQGSTLSPLLFILIMEEVTKKCTGEALWQLLYADDLVLSAESN